MANCANLPYSSSTSSSGVALTINNPRETAIAIAGRKQIQSQ